MSGRPQEKAEKEEETNLEGLVVGHTALDTVETRLISETSGKMRRKGRKTNLTLMVSFILPTDTTVPLSSRPLGRVYFDAGGGRGVEGTAKRREDEEKVRQEAGERERVARAVRRLIVAVLSCLECVGGGASSS